MSEEPICAKCDKPCDERNAFKNRQGQWFHNACIAEHMSNTPEYGLKQLLIEIGLKCCIGIAFGWYITEELLPGIVIGIFVGLTMYFMPAHRRRGLFGDDAW